MQRIKWYGVLAVVELGASIAGLAQTPRSQAPQAKVRELATIEGEVRGFVRLPSGRALIYTVPNNQDLPRIEDSSTFTYNIATKRRTLLGTNMLPASVSPQGDRLAFGRPSEDRTGNFLWTMPIDPQTGIATGQAQRVSLRPAVGRALFSPDGKMLVLSTGPRPDRTWDVTVVPVTGGVERVVANYPRRVIRQAWSADGQALYVETLGDPKTVIERVPLAGGRSEPLVPRTLITDPEVVGLSPDARVAFFQFGPADTRFSYRTASGVEGEISVPLPPADDGFGYTFTLDSMLRYTTMTQVWNQRVRILDLATGKTRDLLPGNSQSSSAAWSPDGRRLAVLTGNLSHYDITVVNADGSSPRRYSVPMHLDGLGQAGVWEMPWSPDGRFLAFRAQAQSTDRQKVGGEHQLAVLDLNSGQTRVLTTSSGQVNRWVWRSDGNAIRFLKGPTVPIGPARTWWSIVEIPLNGPERQLRDISAEFPMLLYNIVFIADREVALATMEDKQTWYVMPLDGGATRRMPGPGTEPGSRVTVSGPRVDGNRLLVGQVDAYGEARVIKILSTAGDSTRALRLPFDVHFSEQGINGLPYANAQQIVVAGKPTGDSVWKLFLVPLDGSATRLLGEIPRGTGGLLAPSPDGKLLAYTSDGITTSKIHEIDFGPAFQAILRQ